MSTAIEVTGFIRGLFTAFEWMNGKTNHGFTFELQLIPITRSVHADLVEHLSSVASEVELEELENWRADLSASLSKWLFQFIHDPCESSRLREDQQFAIFDAQAREELVGIVIDKIASAFSIRQGHRVNLQTNGFYECAWDDFALESDREIVLIHFGVSD